MFEKILFFMEFAGGLFCRARRLGRAVVRRVNWKADFSEGDFRAQNILPALCAAARSGGDCVGVAVRDGEAGTFPAFHIRRLAFDILHSAFDVLGAILNLSGGLRFFGFVGAETGRGGDLDLLDLLMRRFGAGFSIARNCNYEFYRVVAH